MSTQIAASTVLTQCIAHIRAGFTKAEVADVRPYAGEFSADEVAQTSYACPAILVAVLGWVPGGSDRMLGRRHVRTLRLAAFVATKNKNRDDRMLSAMALAERLSVRLVQWKPDTTGLDIRIAALDEQPRCENLYGRAIDRAGQALWLVDWQQSICPQSASGDAPGNLVSVDVVSDASTSVAQTSSQGNSIDVSHEINLS